MTRHIRQRHLRLKEMLRERVYDKLSHDLWQRTWLIIQQAIWPWILSNRGQVGAVIQALTRRRSR